MKWFRKQTAPAGASVQLREAGHHPFGLLGQYVPMRSGEIRLYRAVREAVPVVDAAIYKLIRMVGGVTAACSDPAAERGLGEFLRTVPAGRGQYGVNAFLEGYLDALLTCGRAIGEIVPAAGNREIAAVLWGRVEDGVIVNASGPSITAQCLRVPASNGHMAAVFMTLGKQTSVEEIKEIWQNYKGRAQELELPSAPKQFLHYFEDPSYPQTKLQRDLEGGMAISLGRLRPDTQYDYKFVGLSHNTLRGAAGGSVLLGEFLVAEGYITYKE